MAAGSMRIKVTKVAAPGMLEPVLEALMGNLGNAIGRRARRLVPKRSWALHDTIRVATAVTGPGRVTTTVTAGGMVNGVDVDYAVHVEQGTSKQRAQPYLRPAMLQSKARDLTDERGLRA